VSVDLRLGDCLDPASGLATLADRSVDHLIADPPYSAHTHEKVWVAKTVGRPTVYDGIDFAPLEESHAYEVAAHAARVARRWIIIFTDTEGVALWRSAVIAAGLDYVRTCAWIKPDATPQMSGDRPASAFESFVLAHAPGRKRWNGGGKRNVYTHTRSPGGAPHPTTKPLSLMRELVEDFTDPGDLILDPFAGSGTTGLAARFLGRRFVGWERDANYHAIATRRLRGDEAKPDARKPSLFDFLDGHAPSNP
jgi:site-specific DNA-methyltransferase (adenine-specific)